MNPKMIDEILTRHRFKSDQLSEKQLRALLQDLAEIVEAGVEGAVVEMGCYKGHTTIYLRRLLDAMGDDRPIYAYDSFAGLPLKSDIDASPAGTQFKQGELLASPKDVSTNFKKAGLRPPKIKKAWFEDLKTTDMPPKIAWAFLDGDFYSSISTSIRLVAPNLADGARVVVDDYQSSALPGVKKAVSEFVTRRGLRVYRVMEDMALIRP